PSDGECASAQGAVAFNCLKSKCGAGRVVAAVRRHQRTDEVLITPDQEQKESAHRHWTSDFARCSSAWRSRRDQSLSNTANSCLFSLVPASFRTNTTISREGNVPKRCRKDSRISRLMRLRSTALRMFFLATTKPTRAASRSLRIASNRKQG